MSNLEIREFSQAIINFVDSSGCRRRSSVWPCRRYCSSRSRKPRMRYWMRSLPDAAEKEEVRDDAESV